MAELDSVDEEPDLLLAARSENAHVLRETVVCKYLLDNPQFCRGWFSRHATEEMVADWMNQHDGNVRLELPLLPPPPKEDTETICSLSDSYAQVTRSGRNSVTSELFQDMVAFPKRKRSIGSGLVRELFRTHLQSLDEPDLLMELIRDIANELDMDTLCHKILVNVSVLTDSDRGSLFLAKGSRDSRYLVAKLFDVTPDSLLQDALEAASSEARIPPIPFGVGLAGHVALTKEHLNIRDAYQDPRFNKEIDTRTGYRTVSVMCLPILNFQGDVIGVAQCINKVTGDHFTDQDEEVFRKYLTFCGIGIQNAQLFEMSIQEFKRNQLLLSLAQSIFEETSSLERLISRIMMKTEALLQCEHCRVYLVDTEHDDQGAYQRVEEEKVNPLPAILKPKKFSRPQDVVFTTVFELRRGEQEIRKPSLQELSGAQAAHLYFARHVVATQQTHNWLGTEDELKNSKHTNTTTAPPDLSPTRLKPCGRVLSIPIFNSEGKVIGVAQLVNKLRGQHFTPCDIATLEAFSIFCGLGIYNTQMYESAMRLMAKQRVALEVLSYHASSSVEETKKLMQAVIPSAEKLDLYNFSFSDFSLSDDDTCQATIRMFTELDLIRNFRIPYQVFCRWLLSVKKNYRTVIYHNWRHALNVTQTMFAMQTTGHMKEIMSDWEILALLVACLSHDLDHRGTNNSFQTKTESPLATLYGTSTMEHHHFDQCVMILNSEGNNIFQSLSPEEYKNIITMVESCILSTDLALYFKKKDLFMKLVKSGKPDWTNPDNRDLLRGMMMTACDVSAICKPWKIQRKVAELVASEFFQQGDLEKERLKEQPIAMMDREKKDELPKMQVDFIDCICIPVYKTLTEVQPALSPLLQGCEENRSNWQALADEYDRQHKGTKNLFTRNGNIRKYESKVSNGDLSQVTTNISKDRQNSTDNGQVKIWSECSRYMNKDSRSNTLCTVL